MSVGQPILAARGLVKRYGRVTALDNADFDLMPNEILGVIGDNGAGKSTLIKALCGAVIPDSGEIRLSGEIVNFQSPIDAREAGIETVYQNLALSPALSIADNMFLGREIRLGGPLGQYFRALNRTAMQKFAREKLNELDNYAVRGQLLFVPAENLKVRLIGDVTDLDSACCTQGYLRVGRSLRAANRQFPGLAAGLGYAPPSTDVYDRLSDIDAALRIDTQDGGVSLNADWDIGAVTLTSVSAWRYWDWDVANDRDYTGIPIQSVQRIPSRQDQYSQEFRIASNGATKLGYVADGHARVLVEQIDVRDHSDDARIARRQSLDERELGTAFIRRAVGFHEHHAVHVVRIVARMKSTAQWRNALEPRVAERRRIPEVDVRVDDHAAGTAHVARTRSSATAATIITPLMIS